MFHKKISLLLCLTLFFGCDEKKDSLNDAQKASSPEVSVIETPVVPVAPGPVAASPVPVEFLPPPPPPPPPLPDLLGVVLSGHDFPIANARVTLWVASDFKNALVSEVISDENGEFAIFLPEDVSEGLFYLLAEKEDITLMRLIDQPKEPVVINELTTVASAYTLAQFIKDGGVFGSDDGLEIALSMSEHLVDEQGKLAQVITTSPNGDETNAMRSLNSLANILASCVRDAENCDDLFLAADIKDGDTLDAIHAIALAPYKNVDKIYAQSLNNRLYEPSLKSKPDAFTIAIKFNQTGDESCPFGGPGNIVFDPEGNAWLTNNVIQGTPNSQTCAIVLKPSGQPRGSVFGGGLLGTGFGVTLDQKDHVWFGNFGWGSCPTCLPNGSLSQFKLDGTAISPEDGFQTAAPNDMFRVQGIASDKFNNLWAASFGNNKVVVLRDGKASKALSAEQTGIGAGPFGVAIAKDNSAWVTSTGGIEYDPNNNPNPLISKAASVTRYVITNNHLVKKFEVELGKSLKDIVFDSSGHAWVASTGDSLIYQLSPKGLILGSYGDGGISLPWGLYIDGDDHVWVANFGDDGTNKFRISELCGTNTKACPKDLKTGDAISPAPGFTLPSGGEPVKLANGQPLYGANGPKSFEPLMRQTKVIGDAAGNIWALNNWKPDLAIDTLGQNPGGDGVVIFLGLSKPKE